MIVKARCTEEHAYIAIKKCKRSEQHKYHTEIVMKSHAVAGAMLCVFVPMLVSIGIQ